MPSTWKTLSGLWVITAALIVTACGDDAPTALPTASSATFAKGAHSAAAKKLSVSQCSPGAGGFSTTITNPYFPAPVGYQTIFAGDDDGEELTLQITVLDLTRNIGGVITRVIEEREWVDGELKEVSWNYYAQAADGTVCYFGEDVDIYDEGVISHSGRWCAATPGFAAGIQMPADPRPGMRFALEVAPGVAEDEAKIVGSGPVNVEFGRFTMTVRFRESNPLDGDRDYKVFANGVGLIVDGPAELIDVNQTAGVPGLPSISEQVCGI
jgi:hypothetical protein